MKQSITPIFIVRKFGRGATTVQVAVVLVAVSIAAVIGITQIGTNSNTQLAQTATDVGNPNSLVGRFGNSGSSGGSTGGGTASGGSSDSGSSGSGSGGGSDSGSGTGGTSGGSGSSICP
jgi:Flp pilus assembly pilin Flp